MNNNEENLFNEAKSLKDRHADLKDVELFLSLIQLRSWTITLKKIGLLL